MKKIMFFITILSMAAMANNANAQAGADNILVVWYSWGGNTAAVGNHIAELTGADVFVIEPAEPYSTDYRTCTEEARAEINAGRTRAIKGEVPDIGKYDTVIIGTPNWWSTIAPPVSEFLKRHDLAGKTVLPFVTHGGGREARCFADMRKAAPNARFGDGLVVSGSRAKASRDEVEKWLRSSGIIW